MIKEESDKDKEDRKKGREIKVLKYAIILGCTDFSNIFFVFSFKDI